MTAFNHKLPKTKSSYPTKIKSAKCLLASRARLGSTMLSKAVKIKDKQIVLHLYHDIPISNKKETINVQTHEWISKTVHQTKKGRYKNINYDSIYKKYNRLNYLQW